MEKTKKKSVKEGLKYLLTLFIILFIFIFFEKITKGRPYLSRFTNITHILPFIYAASYAFIAGLLIYYGIDKFDNVIEYLMKTKDLVIVNIISVSIVVIFCFIYSAILVNILQNLFDTTIKIDKWVNVGGYFIGRFVIIVLIYLAKKR